jgi:hypothetical protein
MSPGPPPARPVDPVEAATKTRVEGTKSICVAAPVKRIPEPMFRPVGTARKVTTWPPTANV